MPDDFSSTPSTTGTLAVGSYVRGDVEALGDTDWFGISLVQGVTYRLYLQGSQVNIGSTSQGTLTNPLLRVLDGAGLSLATDDNSFGRNALLDFTAPASGTYYLEASASGGGGTGTYTLSAQPFVPITQFADFLVTGFWNFNAQTHSNSDPHHWAKSALSVNISALNADEQVLAQTVMQRYQDVTNLTFSVTSGPADITFSHLDGTKIMQADWVYDSSGRMTSASIQNSSDWGPANPATGMMNGYLHEFGHALGLGHSGPYNGGSPSYGLIGTYANDFLQQSVMTYFGWPGQDLHNRAVTPQMADIAALQSLYGANPATRLGNTVYGFNSTAGSDFDFATFGPKIAFTIYDSGGIDALDASGFANDQTINLTPGQWSSIGGYVGNIGIYLTSVIENAAGGSGNDIIIGNAAANNIGGGLGADTIIGTAGANYLRGNEGNDSIVGGRDFDDINGNQGNDTLRGGEGFDWVVGGKDNDLLFGEAGGDIVYGNLGADTVLGGDGNDWVRGGQANDSVDGGAGDDLIWGDRGDDTVTGGAGADTFHFFVDGGLDRVTDFNYAAGDRVVLDAAPAYTVRQEGSDTVIDLGGVDRMVLVGVTVSTLPAGWITLG